MMVRPLIDFMITSLQEIAARTVQKHKIMTLAMRDREIFVDALLHPPAPNKHLLKAAEQYSIILPTRKLFYKKTESL